MFTKVEPCKCKNEFQDETYGVGKRLHNVGINSRSCTVCGNKILGGGWKGDKMADAKKEEKKEEKK